MPGGDEKAMEHPKTPPLGLLYDGVPAMELVEEFLGKVERLSRVRAVIAIGSRARGDWRPQSDIDLIIITEDDITSKLRGIRHLGIIDPKPYTSEKLRGGILRCDIELLEGFDGGIVIRDDGIWKKAEELYRAVKELLGIERYKEGWRIKRRIPIEELEEALRKRGHG